MVFSVYEIPNKIQSFDSKDVVGISNLPRRTPLSRVPHHTTCHRSCPPALGCHHPLHSPSFARIRNTVLALDGKGATCSNSVGELVEGPLHEVDIANKLKCARLEGRAEQKVKIVSNSRLIWLASLGVRACIS